VEVEVEVEVEAEVEVEVEAAACLPEVSRSGGASGLLATAGCMVSSLSRACISVVATRTWLGLGLGSGLGVG